MERKNLLKKDGKKNPLKIRRKRKNLLKKQERGENY